eukprot:m.163756 g.163756  ORF g.163756 m.163756 type:complete len:54 (+) comp53091_c0_seq2:539-700(+)
MAHFIFIAPGSADSILLSCTVCPIVFEYSLNAFACWEETSSLSMIHRIITPDN